MKLKFAVILTALALAAATGCERVSAPYVMRVDRHDQDLAVGNRGYLKGAPPPAPARRDLKRPFLAIDVDLAEGGTVSEESRVAPRAAAPSVVKREEIK